MTVREKLVRKLCWFWWKYRRGENTATFKIHSGGVQPSHLMLILPPDFHDFDIARLMIEPLITHTRPRFTTVVLRDNFRTWLSPDLRAKIVTFDPAKKDWLGLPANGICEKAAEAGADVTIDLTPAFNPYTAAITAASRAPLRITVDREIETDFYNFFIKSENHSELKARYDTLLKYV